MNTDNQIHKVAKQPPETVIADRATFLRGEIDRLCDKAAKGSATQEDADLCRDYSHELAEMEG